MIKDIKLDLNNIEYRNLPDMRKQMYFEEFAELEELDKHQLTIDATYLYKSFDKVEVGGFIRNTFDKDVIIKKIIFTVRTVKGYKKLAEMVIDYEKFGVIKKKTGIPFKIEFDNEEIFVENIDDIDESNWRLMTNRGLSFEFTKDIIIDNEPKEQGMRDELYEFVEVLPKLSENKVDVHIFRVGMDGNKLSLITIFRNTHSENKTIERMTIDIVDENGNEVVNKDNSGIHIDVKGGHIQLKKITILPSDIKDMTVDLTKCSYKIKDLFYV